MNQPYVCYAWGRRTYDVHMYDEQQLQQLLLQQQWRQ